MRVEAGEDPVGLDRREAEGLQQAPELVGLDLARVNQLQPRSQSVEERIRVGHLLGRGQAANPPIDLDQQNRRLGVELEQRQAARFRRIQALPVLHGAGPLADQLARLPELTEGRQSAIAQHLPPCDHRGAKAASEVLLEHGHGMVLLGPLQRPLHQVLDGRFVSTRLVVDVRQGVGDLFHARPHALAGDHETHLFQPDLADERLGAFDDHEDLDVLFTEQVLV
mmetsp:Transcript_64387/g.126677  ORF Transcript_64387/g.126677 Transcript_64387/m.126677 type:complete len:224 (+) Transcript_64387:251-922(+)